VTFQTHDDIRDVEFRIYVNAGSGITLHSIAIRQQQFDGPPSCGPPRRDGGTAGRQSALAPV